MLIKGIGGTPIKKFRGKRRYFRNLWKEAADEPNVMPVRPDDWFDLWHSHLDFGGLGNERVKLRREHIKAHITLFNNLLSELEILERPYQVWIHLDGEDAGKDAVFVHTPNPNHDNFPFVLENLKWNARLSDSFGDLLFIKEVRIGHFTADSESGFVIQSLKHGLKLETQNEKKIVSNRSGMD